MRCHARAPQYEDTYYPRTLVTRVRWCVGVSTDKPAGRSHNRSMPTERDEARRIAGTDAYKRSRKDRKKVEMLFAHLKRIGHLW
jgi:hypothetical protein